MPGHDAAPPLLQLARLIGEPRSGEIKLYF
jgi:hypothetical protein